MKYISCHCLCFKLFDKLLISFTQLYDTSRSNFFLSLDISTHHRWAFYKGFNICTLCFTIHASLPINLIFWEMIRCIGWTSLAGRLSFSRATLWESSLTITVFYNQIICNRYFKIKQIKAIWSTRAISIKSKNILR